MKAYGLLCNISKIYQNLLSGTTLSRGGKIGFVCTEKECNLLPTSFCLIEMQIYYDNTG